MKPSWKPQLECLEAREVPARLGLILPSVFVYPPSDPTIVPSPTQPPPPGTGGTGTIVILPPPSPTYP